MAVRLSFIKYSGNSIVTIFFTSDILTIVYLWAQINYVEGMSPRVAYVWLSITEGLGIKSEDHSSVLYHRSCKLPPWCNQSCNCSIIKRAAGCTSVRCVVLRVQVVTGQRHIVWLPLQLPLLMLINMRVVHSLHDAGVETREFLLGGLNNAGCMMPF
jgi:hypothetical protein